MLLFHFQAHSFTEVKHKFLYRTEFDVISMVVMEKLSFEYEKEHDGDKCFV